jgi:hypothetical protein
LFGGDVVAHTTADIAITAVATLNTSIKNPIVMILVLVGYLESLKC